MTTWRIPQLCTRPALRPARALLTPTWLLALLVLAVNDHLLKGAGVVPGAVTGKLSDFAGMLVAPVLLAAVLGLRSRRGLLLCHLAVGAVFAGINLSPAVADAWSWLIGHIYPWHITVDPTDLVALPALALGWRLLVPAMTRPLPALSPIVPRLAEASALCVGTLLCVATSPAEPDRDDVGDWGETDTTDGIDYVDFEADVYLHNGAARDLVVRTRELRTDIQLECGAIDENPGLLLSEPLFGEGKTWTLPPTTNAPARDVTGVDRPCYAVRVEGDEFVAPFILFWHAGEPSVTLVDGDIDDASLHTAGAVLLADDEDQRIVVQESRSPIVFAVDRIPPLDAATPGLDSERLAWSDPPFGDHKLTDVSVGPDGCVAVAVDDEPGRWYLCVPTDAFPFSVDQWVRVDGRGDEFTVQHIPDPMAPVAVPTLRLTVSRGSGVPDVADAVIAAKPDYEPKLAPDPICGTVARPTVVTVRFADGEAAKLHAGDSLTLGGADDDMTVWVAHAEERVVLDPLCAEGPDQLGADVELATLVVAHDP